MGGHIPGSAKAVVLRCFMLTQNDFVAQRNFDDAVALAAGRSICIPPTVFSRRWPVARTGTPKAPMEFLIVPIFVQHR
jgi:hypothetical protein